MLVNNTASSFVIIHCLTLNTTVLLIQIRFWLRASIASYVYNQTFIAIQVIKLERSNVHFQNREEIIFWLNQLNISTETNFNRETIA